MTTVSLNPGAARLTDWRAILDGAVGKAAGLDSFAECAA